MQEQLDARLKKLNNGEERFTKHLNAKLDYTG